jgi:hypothetical protein
MELSGDCDLRGGVPWMIQRIFLSTTDRYSVRYGCLVTTEKIELIFKKKSHFYRFLAK